MVDKESWQVAAIAGALDEYRRGQATLTPHRQVMKKVREQVQARLGDADPLAWAGEVRSTRSLCAARHIAAVIDAQVQGPAENLAIRRPGKGPGTHELVIIDTSYVVVYAVNRRVDAVIVLCVLHDSSQWPDRFRSGVGNYPGDPEPAIEKSRGGQMSRLVPTSLGRHLLYLRRVLPGQHPYTLERYRYEQGVPMIGSEVIPVSPSLMAITSLFLDGYGCQARQRRES